MRKASGESGLARCQRNTAASVRSVVSAVRSTLRSRSRGVACVGEKTWPCPAGRKLRPSEDVGDNNAVCCLGGTSPRSSALASRCLSSDSKPLLPCIEVPLSSVLLFVSESPNTYGGKPPRVCVSRGLKHIIPVRRPSADLIVQTMNGGNGRIQRRRSTSTRPANNHSLIFEGVGAAEAEYDCRLGSSHDELPQCG